MFSDFEDSALGQRGASRNDTFHVRFGTNFRRFRFSFRIFIFGDMYRVLMRRDDAILPHIMHLLISFRKSTSPQLNIYNSNSEH